MKQEKHFDVIIVGGSYSGMAAAMTLGRGLRNVLIIDGGNPCNKQTPHSHNFLTHDGKTPSEIARLAKQQVQLYDAINFVEAFATTGAKTEKGFEIQTESGEKYGSRKLVFATGISDQMPDIPGFAESWGISVLHCPYCHGYEVRQEKTGILANGDLAFDFVTMISHWTNDLTLYTNGKSTLTEQQERKLEAHRINIMQAGIERLEHKNGYIDKVVFKDGTVAETKALYTRLPFTQHSNIPQALGCEMEDGYIKIDPLQKTTVNGIYACGDNASRVRTVANAVSMGTTTGIMLNNEMIKEDF